MFVVIARDGPYSVDMDRAARLEELAVAARNAADRGDGWAANELWREYELVRDGGRDPDELLAEGIALSRMAIDLAGQAGRPSRERVRSFAGGPQRRRHTATEGPIVVGVVEGDAKRPLAVHPPVASALDFEWAYEGAGPHLLAAAIVSDRIGYDPGPEVTRAFMVDVVARLEHEFELSSRTIDAWLSSRQRS